MKRLLPSVGLYVGAFTSMREADFLELLREGSEREIGHGVGCGDAGRARRMCDLLYLVLWIAADRSLSELTSGRNGVDEQNAIHGSDAQV